jgi:iodotyrosine deiodinase
MAHKGFIPFTHPITLDNEEARLMAEHIRDEYDGRRTIRDFSSRPVPEGVLEACLEAASTAPSGAHRQPWQFVVIRSPEVKSKIRSAAEQEEEAFYSGRAPDSWLEALAPLGTDANKSFLETAPVLVAIFARNYDVGENKNRAKNYYVQESVGIATGMLITALHRCGLSTLTHTPSPMGFLNEVLDRPTNERAFLLLVVGYPHPEAMVPDIKRKNLDEIVSFL